MKPKEKAIELVEKFKKYAHSNPSNESELFYRILKENAKECALICVDEILQSKPTFLNSKNDVVYFLGNTETELFYRKVKKEIENL